MAGVLDSGVFLFGPEVEALEAELTSLLGVADVVAVGSGTVALQLALMAHQIGAGDEVVLPAASFYATAAAVRLAGATPVFVDIDPQQYNIDPDRAAAAITPRTRAIIAVHLYGCPAPVRELRALADRRGLVLHEDMAQAIGAAVDGRAVGDWGDSAALSFYPTKNVGAFGDAGGVAVRDAALGRRLRSMRFFGFTGQRDHFAGPGLSGRMDDLQAAVLRVKLRHLAAHTARRRELARRYDAALPHDISRPPAPMGTTSVHHLYVIRCRHRDALRRHLTRAGVGTEIHYRIPLHRQPLFSADAVSLPVAEAWADEVLSLPLYPYLADSEQDRVIAAILELEGAR
jgi:dTDP-4-amino-4,6-dideoxygalactose transaminase